MRGRATSSSQSCAGQRDQLADLYGLARRAAAAGHPLGVCGAAHAQGLGCGVVCQAHAGLPGAQVCWGHFGPTEAASAPMAARNSAALTEL